MRFLLLAMFVTAILKLAPTTALADSAEPPEYAFHDVTDFADVGLEDLINIEVAVASKTSRTLRESPGIISVITRDEIRRLGARDLTDVLRTVPGLDFGSDVQGIVGLGARGIWGHEGKILLLIDGVEMNEQAYSTLQFGFHYPVDQIERIEIIRGPGSVLYGGYAELAVINIITSSAKDLKGARISAQYGRSPNDFGFGETTIMAGRSFAQGEGSATFAATNGLANRSGRHFSDVYGNQFRMPGQQWVRPTHLNTSLAYKSLSLRYIFDEYETRHRDGFDTVVPQTPNDFRTHGVLANYSIEPQSWLTLTPTFLFLQQQPWHAARNQIDPAFPALSFEGRNLKYKGGLTAVLAHDQKSLLLGAEFNRASQIALGYRDAIFHSASSFAQGEWDTSYINLFTGVRYEHHTTFGDAAVPRAGATAVVGDGHIKLLYSRAYRTPSAQNYLLAFSSLKPELTTVVEAELGWNFNNRFFLVGNVFDQKIGRPIVYFYDTATAKEGYQNKSEQSSQGFEVEARFKSGFATLRAAYGFYRPRGHVGPDFAIPGNSTMLLAFPNHKGSLEATLEAPGKLRLTPSLVAYGQRFGMTAADSSDSPIVTKFNPSYLANFSARWEGLPVTGFAITGSVFNILGQNHPFIQPYLGYHAPLPDRGREYVLAAEYAFEM